MGYERYPRDANPQGDYYGRSDPQDYGRDYGSGRDNSYSSARDYRSAGYDDNRGGRDAGERQGSQRPGYGARDYGNQRYGQRDEFNRGREGYAGRGDQDRERSENRYVQQNRWGNGHERDHGRGGEYHGSYGSDGRRFEDVGRYSHADDDYRSGGDRNRGRQPQGYGRQPQGYDYEDRGFIARAGDEVRSWFGDEDAERRREMDSRYDERAYNDRDHDYHSWRRGQIDALDRDYDEYRREHRSKFENEFSSWRSTRQTQRDALNKVEEHMDVVGADGEHVGTVDKVRGDRILLTKNDVDAGGHHHSIPSSWIQTVDGKTVTLSKSAADAKRAWRDEERNQAVFGDTTGAGARGQTGQATANATSGAASASDTQDASGKTLNRSFSGTY